MISPPCWLAGVSLAAAVFVPLASHAGELTFEERVRDQRAIEEVYWRHRIWPKENPAPRPSLSEAVPDAVIRKKVEDSLRKSNAFEKWWQRPISSEQLRAEVERMARGSIRRNGRIAFALCRGASGLLAGARARTPRAASRKKRTGSSSPGSCRKPTTR